MSHSDAARDALLNVVRNAASVRNAGSAYIAVQKTALESRDCEEAASRVLELIAAAETLEACAGDVKDAARQALATYIEETGAPDVITMHHRAAMAKQKAFASADQPDLTPPEYMTQPHPDRSLILKDLNKGIDVPGWSLRIPNARTLRITARK